MLDQTVDEENIMQSDKMKKIESEHEKDITDDNNKEDTAESTENEQRR